jgi:hypothetical protein
MTIGCPVVDLFPSRGSQGVWQRPRDARSQNTQDDFVKRVR